MKNLSICLSKIYYHEFNLFVFSLLLGIRHGIDPDHLAVINGINLNNHASGKSSSWNGLFFSLGHGITVTLIGILLIAFKEGSKSYSRLVQYTEWIPILILLFTGFYGIYNLLIKSKEPPHNHIHYKITSFLTNTKYPAVKLFITGLFFALIFDTSTQVAAWALIGEENSQNLYSSAVLVGLFFTIGMMITDTLNGLFFYSILIEEKAKFNFRLYLSILIIISSLMIGIIQLLEKTGYTIQIPDQFKLIWGLLIMVITTIGMLINLYHTKRQSIKI